MRIIVVSGQGNSLQSAAALATACYAASTGLRVLVASVGPTHILGALMSQSLGSRPLEIDPHLVAMEISARDEIGQRWESARPGLRSGLVRRFSEVGSEELPAFPGMDVIAAMMVAEKAAQTKRFDLLVFDGPGTESLLRSMASPDMMRWLIRLFFGLDRGPGRSRLSQDTAMLPMTLIAPSSVAPLQDFRVLLEQYRTRFEALNSARVRLALPVEELSLPPVRQELGGLGLYGMEVDTIIARGSAERIDRATQQSFTAALGAPRPPLLVHELDVTATERHGWTERGKRLYSSRPEGLGLPSDGPPEAPELASDTREVRLHIPFLDSRDLDIAVASEEVVVRVGQFRRHVLLPALVNGGRLRARVENEVLRLWVE